MEDLNIARYWSNDAMKRRRGLCLLMQIALRAQNLLLKGKNHYGVIWLSLRIYLYNWTDWKLCSAGPRPSSFMKRWKELEEVIDTCYRSFMKYGEVWHRYLQCLNFPNPISDCVFRFVELVFGLFVRYNWDGLNRKARQDEQYNGPEF